MDWTKSTHDPLTTHRPTPRPLHSTNPPNATNPAHLTDPPPHPITHDLPFGHSLRPLSRRSSCRALSLPGGPLLVSGLLLPGLYFMGVVLPVSLRPSHVRHVPARGGKGVRSTTTFTIQHSPFNVHHSPLATYYSTLTTHHSPLATNHS